MKQTGTQAIELNRFLAEVEGTAFHLARYAVQDSEEALDLVQDAMFTLARKYAGKPAAEWRPLFFRILQNGIRDWHRRKSVSRRFFTESIQEGMDRIETSAGRPEAGPMQQANTQDAMSNLQVAVERLPLRQQQAFLLRSVEGMNVAETAKAMDCSQGSVKTHYSRAVHSLRETLKEHWL